MLGSPTFTQWRESGRHFHYRGHRIFYRTGGSGNGGGALLLIHGFPTASWDWHLIWPGLCERFERVIAPDMIGFGYSAKPPRHPYAIRDQADLHEALLRELGVRQYHILAHDYGDTVAQELLARDLERPSAPQLLSVCFLNGGLFPETHHKLPIQKLLATPLGPLVARLINERRFQGSFGRIFGAETRPGPEQLSEFWRLIDFNGGARLFHKLIAYIAERRASRERWVGALQRSTLKLRLILGPDDPASGAHMGARYRELVPDPDIVELPGIGHYPQVEAPDATLEAFLEFHRAQ